MATTSAWLFPLEPSTPASSWLWCALFLAAPREVARSAGFLISLMGQGLRTDGQVHAHQIKSLDWASRKASLVERAPGVVVQEVLMCLQSVLAD